MTTSGAVSIIPTNAPCVHIRISPLLIAVAPGTPALMIFHLLPDIFSSYEGKLLFLGSGNRNPEV